LRTRTRWSSPAPLLADKKLYLVTPLRSDLLEFLGAAIRGGVDVVQIRDRGVPDGRLLELLTTARGLAGALKVPFGVNDRPDLAALCGADFVHLGQEDIPVDAARSFGLPVGLSTHAPGEIDEAAGDYIGVGPVYPTPTKEGRAPVGLDLVRYATEHARVPWFAIGGIDATNVEEVVAAGARRIAVVRAIGDAGDPERAARELRAALPA
jgi:thiamine-phosphate pyrophosphorylase